MGLSSLERCVDALGGRLEIHAVLDDADTTLTALSGRRPQEGDGGLSDPTNRLRRGTAASTHRSASPRSAREQVWVLDSNAIVSEALTLAATASADGGRRACERQ